MTIPLSSVAITEKNAIATDSVWLLALEITVPGLADPLRIVRNNENVTWRGETWVAFPFEIDEIGEESKGEVPQVEVRVSNVSRAMEAYLQAYDIYTKANGYSPVTVSIYVLNSKRLTNTTTAIESWGSWNPDGTGAVVTANAALAPDGTTTASRVVFSASGGTGNVIYHQFSSTASTDHEFSIHMRCDSGTVIVPMELYSDTGPTAYQEEKTLTTSWQRFSVKTNALPTSDASYMSIGWDMRSPPDGNAQTSNPTIYIWSGDWTDPEVEHLFELKQPKTNAMWATFLLGASNPFNQRYPQSRILKNHCRFIFKGTLCAYAGAETTCDKTLVRCRALSNSTRFGGFPGVGIGGLRLA